MSDTPDANVQVSHESNGRTLSGMGASPEQLEAVMERHAPEEPAPSGTAVTPPAEGGEAPPAPKQTRGQQRFADLTKERDDAKAEAATAKAEREALARERDELKARVTPTPEPARSEPAKPVRPSSERFPAFDVWMADPANTDKDFDDYTDARVAHNYAALRAAERDEESRTAAERTQRETVTNYHAEVAKIRAELPDFDTVLATLGPRDVSLVVQHAAFQVGPRAAYYLAQHPEELRELTADTLMTADTPGFAAAVAATKRYLARLIAPPAAAAPQRRAVAPPPAPYTPVNGGTATTATPSSELAGKGFDFDKSGYREKRAAERKAARR